MKQGENFISPRLSLALILIGNNEKICQGWNTRSCLHTSPADIAQQTSFHAKCIGYKYSQLRREKRE